MSDEDLDIETEVRLGERPEKKPVPTTDPFKKDGEVVRKLVGLDRNYVRRQERKLKKKAGTKQIEPDAIDGYTYFDCVMPPENLGYLAKLYDISSAHHAVVDAKVAAVFGLGYGFVESRSMEATKANTRTESGRAKADKFFKDEVKALEDFLDNCNPDDVFEQVLKKVGTDYEATGNGYIEIGRDVTGKIGYIGHIPAENMRVRRFRDGYVQIYSNQVVFFRNFGDRDTPNPLTDDKNPNEIIHLKKYTPSHTYYGLPDILSAKNALAGNEFASRYNLDFFENQAIPRYAIIARKSSLSAPSVARLIEFFESGVRGQPHRTVFIPLSDDPDAEIKFEQIDTGDKDAAFSTFRNENNAEMFMANRVPFTRAGVYAKGMTLAAARDADKVFKESVSRPEQQIFEKLFNKIVRELTNAALFKLNELELTDADVQSQIDERDLRSGTKVPDEVRAERGWGPRPDGKGNEPMALSAQQQADQKAKAKESRKRDQNRTANATDGKGEGRNEKGAGRSTQ